MTEKEFKYMIEDLKKRMKTIVVLALFFVASFAIAPPQPKGPTCNFCIWAVSNVQSYLANNDSQAQIISALDNLCSVFVIPNIVAQCQNFVNTYVPQIIQLIQQNDDPAKVCSDLKLCSSRAEIQAAYSMLTNIPETQNSMSPKGAACNYCVWAVSYIVSFLANNQSQAQIVSALNNLCSVFVIPNIIGQCQNFVNTYVPQIIQMIKQNVDPSMVCTQLKLCSSQADALSSNKAMLGLLAANKDTSRPQKLMKIHN